MQDISIEATGNHVEIEVRGKLTKESYEYFIPMLEDVIVETQEKLRVLFVMRDFYGWTAGALWADIKFDLRHFHDIERLAIAGEKRWQQGMAMFAKPFTHAAVRYFDLESLEEARTWVYADELATT